MNGQLIQGVLSPDDPVFVSAMEKVIEEIDSMRPMPKRIRCTKKEAQEFTAQQYAEYGQVWSMPVIIRDRIRALLPDGRMTSRTRRLEVYPRASNTGVTSKKSGGR